MPFAHCLASGILQAFGRDENLSSIQILLPSRRAVQSMQGAFTEVANGKTLLMPKMAPIGDIEEDGSDILFLSFGGNYSRATNPDLTLPASISSIEKQLILTQLIERMPLAGKAISTAQAIRLAQSLSHLLDQVYQAGTPPERLPKILSKQVPDDLAHHWQDIVTFLNIIIQNWPVILRDKGLLDPVIRKLKLADQQMESWKTAPPDHPIILAGSTGSLPKTRQMMAAVASLPKGLVVFPGLENRPFPETEKSAIAEDTGHPFHQLFKTLSQLDVAPETVLDWPFGECKTPPISEDRPKSRDKHVSESRRQLLMQVFKPAPLTRDWRSIREDFPDMGKTAIKGLSLIKADDIGQEADIIASVMRKTLEEEGKTAMLVTPDRKLARQVRAALLKWNLDIEDSAGTDLLNSHVGSFLALISEWFATRGGAQSLLALLRHPLSSAGLSYKRYTSLIRALEMEALRGYLADSSIEGIRAQLKAQKDSEDLCVFYEQYILTALAPLIDLFDVVSPSLAMLADAHGRAAERLAQNDIENEVLLKLWETPDGKQGAALLSELADIGGHNAVRHSEYANIFRALCSGIMVRKIWRSHPRLAILGTVEARMQNADLIILGGVNEGVWPPRQQADPWTNEKIREALGLPDRRWRSGLSAHDFFMLATHPEVMITRSVRADDTPTTPSRWIERMQAVLRAAALEEGLVTQADEDVVAAISAHQSLYVKAREMPRPCPALSLRPEQYSATDFDLLISDPYQVYARKVLRLKKLEEIDKRPDNALKGNLIHSILASFLTAYPSGDLPENAPDLLYQLAERSFAPYVAYPPVRLFWQTKFREIANWFCQKEQERREENKQTIVEKVARISITTDAGEVAITARADRIDNLADGRSAIIDYKTGSVPSKKEVEQGRATQLLVEAALLGAGAFPISSTSDAESKASPMGIQLFYWQLAGHYGRIADIVEVTPQGLNVEKVLSKLQELVKHFSCAETPFLPEPDAASRPKFSDYRHLARVREWRPQEVKDD